MPVACACRERHERRRIVLTGGPGAGKTAVLELLRQSLCRHVQILPEAAGIVFGGGLPRRDTSIHRRAAQRAIFCVQRELEEAADDTETAIALCDRGLVDGAAYWPGPDELWDAVGMSRSEALARYDAVIHLRVPPPNEGYDRRNPLRVESADEARAIDSLILAAWNGHSRRYVIEPAQDFMTKAETALALVQQELPECCRGHVTRALGSSKQRSSDTPPETEHECAS